MVMPMVIIILQRAFCQGKSNLYCRRLEVIEFVCLIRHRRAKALELEPGFRECPNTHSPQVLG